MSKFYNSFINYLLIGWHKVAKLTLNKKFLGIFTAALFVLLSTVGVLIGTLVGGGGDPNQNFTNTPIEQPTDLIRGGNLRINLPTPPSHLDPHQTVSNGVLTWGAGLVYSRLFRYSLSGTTQIECDICLSWERLSGTKFLVKIRDDVFWQNLPPLFGRQLTVEDVIKSYERQKNLLNGELLKNFKSFKEVGEGELEIELFVADKDALAKLAHAGSSIIPPELYQNSPNAILRSAAVGSGPWIYDGSLSEGSDINWYLANDNYFEEGLPYLGSLSIFYSEDVTLRALTVEFDEILGLNTAITDVALIDQSLATRYTEGENDLSVFSTPSCSNGIEVVINTLDGGLASIETRQALVNDITTNLEALGLNASPSLGLGCVTDSSIDELSLDYFEAVNGFENKNLQLLDFDELTIVVGDFSDTHLLFADQLAQRLSQFGEVVVEKITTFEYANRVEFGVGEPFQIALGQATPSDFLGDKLLSIYHSKGPVNTSGYATEETDQLIERFVSEYDEAKQNEIYSQIYSQIALGAHRFLIDTKEVHFLTKPNVNGFMPELRSSNNFFLTTVWKS